MFDEMRLVNFLERNISENNKLLEEFCCEGGNYRMATPTLTQMGVEWCKLRECLINNGVNVSKLLKEE